MKLTWEEVIKSHEIRKMYQSADLEKIQHLPKEMMDFAKRWIDAPQRPSLFLTGSVGSGKTYFMTALLRAVVERGHSWFKFTRSVDLFDELLQKLMTSNSKSNEYALRSIAEVPFLFIDDVGVETMTDRVKKEYFSIIDYRISEMLPFVFTSNFSKEEFGKLLGDRVESRMHMCAEIVFPGRDLRKEITFFKI
jgi:DNA replication protein DnaC